MQTTGSSAEFCLRTCRHVDRTSRESLDDWLRVPRQRPRQVNTHSVWWDLLVVWICVLSFLRCFCQSQLFRCWRKASRTPAPFRAATAPLWSRRPGSPASLLTPAEYPRCLQGTVSVFCLTWPGYLLFMQQSWWGWTLAASCHEINSSAFIVLHACVCMTDIE